MPRLDNTPFIMTSLDRHNKKIEELMRRVKELETKLSSGEVEREVIQEIKRGPGRPRKEESIVNG
jgi:hypothetical protein